MSITTIARPKIEIDMAIQQLILHQYERMTIVHCNIYTPEPTGVRIWPTTFLVQEDGTRSKLLHAFNISFYPNWTLHDVYDQNIRFTLVFEGLKGSCNQFFLLEDIPEPGGFYSAAVARNETDVYETELLT
jgi:hypothetical protein